MKQLIFCTAFAILLIPHQIPAQLIIQTAGQPNTIEFENTFDGVNEGAFLGQGFRPSPNDGQIDSDAFRVTGLSIGDLNFGEIGVSGDFARGNAIGDVNQGGIYSFEAEPGNYCLGVQPKGGDFRPGSFTLLVINNTNEMITSTRLAYKVWFLNSEDRSTMIEFDWSEHDMSYIDEPAQTIRTPMDAKNNPSWQNETRDLIIPLNLSPGDSIYLRWTGIDNGGRGPSLDQFGLDSISVIMESGALLPVQWVSFDVHQKRNNAELIWKTSEEINNELFEVQHSTDAEIWEKVGERTSNEAPTVVNTYSFLHNDVQAGYNYYRIKQVDKDGQFDYSPVRKVHFSNKVLKRQLNVYPSPADEQIYVENRHLYKIDNASIINSSGRLIQTFDHSIPQQINVSDLPEGVYWLTIQTEQDTLREKFIIQ